ncbi:MAG TPA: glycosyltransferase [Gemmatimonadales bacterium]|nr:glycosyltransferase [Gemmatimonadales bacterium]
MLQTVTPRDQRRLAEYETVAHLAPAVRELRSEAAGILPRLAGRTMWMVNSTAVGGGVAEMLPALVTLLRDLGVRAEWVVIGSDEPAFFDLTKRIHNLIHGAGDPLLGAAERQLFEAVNRKNTEELTRLVRPGDVVVVHDPQPLPLAGLLPATVPLIKIWRCHIGLDAENAATRAAWDFLDPYLVAFDHAVFSAPEYIPKRLAGKSTVIYPGIDPLAPKNRELSLRGAVAVLCNSGLLVCPGPTVYPQYPAQAQRTLPDGSFAPANSIADIGLLTRPIITQVSRWDRLKGFLPLLEAFTELKKSIRNSETGGETVHARRLDLARLVLAGPDPGSIQDDPEAQQVLRELVAAYTSLPGPTQDDIAIVTLPMGSQEQNALMVNALQRASSVVVQNSLREGFGLTIAEAMWKRIPVLSNSRACGPRVQVRDGIDGRLIQDPTDVHELEHAMRDMLSDPERQEYWGRNAQRRVHELFLVTSQLRSWGRLLAQMPALMEFPRRSAPEGR